MENKWENKFENKSENKFEHKFENKFENKCEDKWERKWEKKRGRGRNPEILKKRIFWLNKKREELEKRLLEFENFSVEGILPPNLFQEQQVIEKKLIGISARLEKLSLISSESEQPQIQSSDPETLPDISTPKVVLADAEKEKVLAELSDLRQNLFKSCCASTKESKCRVKFARNALDSFTGNPESEEGKKLVQEWEAAQANFKENKKVLKSLKERERVLCDMLGMTKKEVKMMYKQDKNFCKKQSHKKFKVHK